MAPSLVQQSSVTFSGAAATTLSATLPGAATAGNIIWFASGGDKDIGTLTLSGFTLIANLRSTSVSLILGYKVAAGGETTISGTITGANTNGCDVWVGEYSETGAGAWTIAGSATNNTNETTTLTWSSGTTGSTTQAGLGIACWSVDSVTGHTVATYTNSFAEGIHPSQGGGGGESGLWLVTASVSSATAAETTITRQAGSTADQMSGAIAVFSRATVISVAPSGVASGEAFGTTNVKLNVVGTGIASGEAFGTSAVSLNIAGTGIASGEAFGAATVKQFITATGIASGEAFGVVTVSSSSIVGAGGIGSGEAFGTATLALNIAAVGVGSAEAFGSLAVVSPIAITVDVGIDSGELFGLAVVNAPVTHYRLVQPSRTDRYRLRSTALGIQYVTNVVGFTVWYDGTGIHVQEMPSQDSLDSATYVWLGGHDNISTNKAIYDLWLANGLDVEIL